MPTDSLRHHPTSPNNELKGVSKSDIVTSDAYILQEGQAVPDALQADCEVSNKPGSSIPSIFGRLIFFRTALLNYNFNANKNSGKSTSNDVYSKIVSQWLDLMELVFNRNGELRFEKWNAKTQIAALKQSHHTELADALEKHTKKFFGDQLQNIFLIWQDDVLIGGTSPYTFVFTSPNWNSGKSVISLLGREDRFREFIYKLYLAISTNSSINADVYVPVLSPNGGAPTMTKIKNPGKEMVKGFIDYVGVSLDKEHNQELKARIMGLRGRYSIDDLNKEYDIVNSEIDKMTVPISVATLQVNGFTLQNQQMNLPAVLLNLYGRSMSDIQSDFFIDSDFHKDPKLFDPVNLPMVIVEGASANLRYYDNVVWDLETSVPQNEDTQESIRKLPGCDAYKHRWLTTIDFLDSKIISLPYLMDEAKFENVINIEGRSYLLPLKPKALKYFTRDHLAQMVELRDENGKVKIENGSLVVTLNVPIRNNDRSRTNSLSLVQRYNLKTDVVTINPIGVTENPISVGISPFVRIPNVNGAQDQNIYTVMLQYPEVNDADISLSFYNEKSDEPVGGDFVVERIRNGSTLAKFYRLLHFSFDAVEMKLSKGGADVFGMILPKFNSPQTGNNTYVYGIDFGTTNTHIAYIGSNDNTATSFGSKEISEQVEYLAKSPDPNQVQTHGGDLSKIMNVIYGNNSLDTLIDQAREFFPNFVGDDYSFPIRTVSYQEEVASIPADGLFSVMSIGFRYNKEVISDAKYYTNLKWDLNSYKVADADNRARLFFVELLCMIRTHWVTRQGVNLNVPPTIVLTFPLAMANTGRIMRLWHDAYKEVFGQNLNPAIYIKELAESLAPALNLINAGNLSVSGILNIDIGGGTTDIQYYREEVGRKIARYNSVLFAGDDLWGCGYENIVRGRRNVEENIFTRFADNLMGVMSIRLGFDNKDYSSIRIKGKEKINLLLRDANGQFSNIIKTHNDGLNDARLVVMLHYAAILYHVVNWIKSDPRMSERFPAVINFTGFGSKYIEAIFDSNDKLQDYTVLLLKAFGIENLPTNFRIEFSAKPKDVTAEGAAIFGRNQGANLPQRPVMHHGFEGAHSNEVVRFSQTAELKDKVVQYFDKFLDAFRSVSENGLSIPQMTDEKVGNFRTAASISFDQVVNDLHNPNDPDGNNPVSDSMFFWMLKGSLFDFDNY